MPSSNDGSDVPGRPPDQLTSDAEDMNLRWTGSVGDLMTIDLVNLFLQVITLGIYYFWAKTRIRNYAWSAGEVNEDPFVYRGTGWELCWAFLRLAVPLGLLLVFVSWSAPMMVKALIYVLAAALGFVGWYLGKWYGRRYLYSRTTWRGIRFGLSGSALRYFLIHVAGRAISSATLGLLYPIYRHWVVNYVIDNTWFGDEKFSYDGTTDGMAKNYFLFWLLSIFTLGFAWYWWYAREQRYVASQTSLGGLEFSMDHTGGDLLWLRLGNGLIWICTLGLGGFWVKYRNFAFLGRHLSLEGTLDVSDLAQSTQQTPEYGEGLIELASGSISMFGFMKL